MPHPMQNAVSEEFSAQLVENFGETSALLEKWNQARNLYTEENYQEAARLYEEAATDLLLSSSDRGFSGFQRLAQIYLTMELSEARIFAQRPEHVCDIEAAIQALQEDLLDAERGLNELSQSTYSGHFISEIFEEKNRMLNAILFYQERLIVLCCNFYLEKSLAAYDEGLIAHLEKLTQDLSELPVSQSLAPNFIDSLRVQLYEKQGDVWSSEVCEAFPLDYAKAIEAYKSAYSLMQQQSVEKFALLISIYKCQLDMMRLQPVGERKRLFTALDRAYCEDRHRYFEGASAKDRLDLLAVLAEAWALAGEGNYALHYKQQFEKLYASVDEVERGLFESESKLMRELKVRDEKNNPHRLRLAPKAAGIPLAEVEIEEVAPQGFSLFPPKLAYKRLAIEMEAGEGSSEDCPESKRASR